LRQFVPSSPAKFPDKAAQSAAKKRHTPEQPKLLQGPAADEQRLPCRGIDRSVGERKRNQVNNVSARPMAIGGRNRRIRAKTFQEILQQDFSAYFPPSPNLMRSRLHIDAGQVTTRGVDRQKMQSLLIFFSFVARQAFAPN
jgi:hypothetical protein